MKGRGVRRRRKPKFPFNPKSSQNRTCFHANSERHQAKRLPEIGRTPHCANTKVPFNTSIHRIRHYSLAKTTTHQIMPALLKSHVSFTAAKSQEPHLKSPVRYPEMHPTQPAFRSFPDTNIQKITNKDERKPTHPQESKNHNHPEHEKLNRNERESPRMGGSGDPGAFSVFLAPNPPLVSPTAHHWRYHCSARTSPRVNSRTLFLSLLS